jgi:parallel beta-helix repeat protein
MPKEDTLHSGSAGIPGRPRPKAPRWWAAAALGALAISALPLSPASAAVTRVVDDDGQATTTNCNSSTATPYSTIQAAVDASAAGDRILVCPGTYDENVDVDTPNLSVEGPSSIKHASGKAIVRGETGALRPNGSVILNADGITWMGFTVSDNTEGPGMYTSPAHFGYDIRGNVFEDNVFGLYLNSAAAPGGTSGTRVRDNKFADNNTRGPANGNGIYSDQGLQNASITGNRFQENLNGAVLITGVDGTTQNLITVSRNTSSDDRTAVYLFRTTNATVENNTISNSEDDSGSAIFIGGGSSDILIRKNEIKEAGFSGIALRATDGNSDIASPTNVDIQGNTIRKAYNNGIDVTAPGPTANKVRDNSVKDSRRAGIFFGAGTSGNTISGNSAGGSGTFDCQDDTGPTASTVDNTWTKNEGRSSSPSNLCKRK